MKFCGPVLRAIRSTALLLTAVLTAYHFAYSQPETSIIPSISLEGAAAASGFGEAASCSKANATTGGRSFIAAGAPNFSSGQGRVYIFDPQNSTTPLQTIVSPFPVNNGHFGAAVAFLNDLNSDDIDELAIGEPGSGVLYLFGSSTGGGTLQYSYCGSSLSVATSFGAKILALRGTSSFSERLVVSAPDAGRTYGINLSSGCGPITLSATRFTTADNGDQFGISLAEIPDALLGNGDLASDVIAGHPGYSGPSSGRVQLLGSNETSTMALSLGEADYGGSVAGSPFSSYFAVGSPQRNSGSGEVDIHGGVGSTAVCSVSRDGAGSFVGFGSTVAHLGTTFTGFFGGSSIATFAAYRPEPDTGGSVGIFALTGTCTTPIQINNCIQDASQQQGKVIVGGADCTINPAGTPRPMLIVSSPNWNNGTGRLDIAVSGDELMTAAPCDASDPTFINTATEVPTEVPTGASTDAPTEVPTEVPTGASTDAPTEVPTEVPTGASTDAPTDTPTNAPTNAPTIAPTDTPTNAPTNTPSNAPTIAPTDTPTNAPTNTPSNAPTIAPTDTPTNAPTNTPTDAPTIAPTDMPTIEPTDEPTITSTIAPTVTPTDTPTDAPATYSPTDTPTSTATPTPAPAPATIAVQPGQRNMPAPEVAVENKTVVVMLPSATPLLTASQRKAAMKLLTKRRLSKTEAESALNNLVVSYEVVLTSLARAQAGTSSTVSLKMAVTNSVKATASKKKVYKTRSNRLAIRNLPPGSYSVSYQMQISTKRPAVVLGATKASRTATFRVR